MLDFIQNNLTEILAFLATVLTGAFTAIGAMIKKKYTESINDKTKKDIVENCVKYTEQICTNCMKKTSEQKKKIAKEKAIEWLGSKGITVSDTELDILIEAAVNGLRSGLNGKTD